MAAKLTSSQEKEEKKKKKKKNKPKPNKITQTKTKKKPPQPLSPRHQGNKGKKKGSQNLLLLTKPSAVSNSGVI